MCLWLIAAISTLRHLRLYWALPLWLLPLSLYWSSCWFIHYCWWPILCLSPLIE